MINEADILGVLKDEFHGIQKTEVMARLGISQDNSGSFDEVWRRLLDSGRIARTSRGFKASVSPFGSTGWGGNYGN